MQRFAPVFILLLLVAVSGCQPSGETLETPADTLLPVSHDGRWGFVDRSGDIVIEPQFDQAWHFSDDLALVKQEGRFGYVDRGGQFVIEPHFSDAWHFSDGVAPVEIDSSWTYIDRSGEVIGGTQFRVDAQPQDDSQDDPLRLVLDEGRYGFGTRDGRQVIEAQFENAWRFSEGLARVKQDGKWGYIDAEGAFVIEPQFDLAWDFHDGVAMVQVEGEVGYIDMEGDFIWKPGR